MLQDLPGQCKCSKDGVQGHAECDHGPPSCLPYVQSALLSSEIAMTVLPCVKPTNVQECSETLRNTVAWFCVLSVALLGHY